MRMMIIRVMPPKRSAGKNGDEPDPFEVFQKYLKKYGNEYERWPEVRKATKALLEDIEENTPECVEALKFSDLMDPIIARVIFNALRQSNYHFFKAVRLWQCGGGDAMVDALCGYINSPPTFCPVREIQCVDIGMTANSCEFLGRALNGSGNPNITYLRLDYNLLGDVGVARIATSLASNKSVRKLSLQHCNFSKGGALAVAQCLLATTSQIRELNIRGNHIGTDGITQMLRLLKGSKSLKVLNISDTGFHGDHPEFMNALCDLVRSNLNLQEYYLVDNSFTNKGAEQLIPVLQGCSHVLKFDVSERISPNLMEQLKEAIGKKKKKAKKKKKKA